MDDRLFSPIGERRMETGVARKLVQSDHETNNGRHTTGSGTTRRNGEEQLAEHLLRVERNEPVVKVQTSHSCLNKKTTLTRLVPKIGLRRLDCDPKRESDRYT